jgi:hypothetical protein
VRVIDTLQQVADRLQVAMVVGSVFDSRNRVEG